VIRRANRVGSGQRSGNREPRTANEKPSFANRDQWQGAPAYRVKNRRNPPKIRDPRSAATGLPSGGKGHVSLKYLYKKRYGLFHVKQLPIF